MEIKVHRKENFYYWLMVAISIIFYSMLTFKFINSPDLFSSDIFKSPLIVISLYYLGIFLFFSLFSRICFLGHLRGNSVKLTPTQFPELFQILKTFLRHLKLWQNWQKKIK